MTSVLFGVFEIMIGMSLFILLLLLGLKLFGGKFTAKCRYIIWALVMLRLAIPISIGILPSFIEIPVEPTVIESEVPSATPAEDSIAPIDPSQPTDFGNIATTPSVPIENSNADPNSAPIPPFEIIVSPPPPTNPVFETPIEQLISWEKILKVVAIVYFSGAAVFLVWNLVSYVVYTRKILRSTKEADSRTQQIYRAICQKYKIKKRPILLVASGIHSPAAFGLFRRRIVLPDIAFTDNGLVGTLAHEVIHCRRGDLYVKFVALIARSFGWFNPFVHIAAFKCEMEMELSCDEKVLGGSSDKARAAYGEVMLDIIRRCRRSRGALTTHFNPQKSAVTARFQNILYGSGKRRGRILIGICLVLCVLAGTFVACRVDNVPDETTHEIGYTTTDLSELLSEDQLALYEKANKIYPLFNGISDNINVLHLLFDGASFEERQAYITEHSTGSDGVQKIDGVSYLPSYGEYNTFDEFKALCLSVFTEEYFGTLNQGDKWSAFIDVDNQLYYIDAAKGGQFGYAPDEFPDKYELVEMTDTKIVFNVVGHYKSSHVDSNFTVETRKFPVTFVLEDDGWRIAKFASAALDDFIDEGENVPKDTAEFAGAPSLTISRDALFSEMERMEESESLPADKYTIHITGMSVPVKLYMDMDCVAGIEAYEHYVKLDHAFDIYGNCSFDLFEADGSVILEGGYYEIGDIYILSPEKYSIIKKGSGSSYWLWLDDNDALKYRQKHNEIATIIQTGALSIAVSYDEFLMAVGDASIQNGEVVFSKPTESYTMSDNYDLDQEFIDLWSDSYNSIEDKFAENSARNVKQLGQGPFVGYVADRETPWIVLYTAKDGKAVAQIPYEIFNGWPATQRTGEGSESWKAGYMGDYIHFYYADFGDFRWAGVHLTSTSLGSGRMNIATSIDGGKTWSCGSYMDDYGGNHALGMGFASKDVAFISFDYMYEHDLYAEGDYGPVISRTLDGGKTWARMELAIPDSLKEYRMNPFVPIFDEQSGRYPIQLYSENYVEEKIINLVTADGGLTWEWDIPTTSGYTHLDSLYTSIFSMTAGEIKAKYGEMQRVYLKYGGTPVYVAKNLSGMELMYSHLKPEEELPDDMLCDVLLIPGNGYAGKNSPSVCGIEIGSRIENSTIRFNRAEHGEVNGGAHLYANIGKYIVHAIIELEPNMHAPSYDSPDDVKEQWVNAYLKAPTGKVTGIEIHRTYSSNDQAVRAFNAVLNSKRPIFDTQSATEITLSKYLQNNGLSSNSYTMVDLDGDGVQEMVLKLAIGTSEYYGFLLLRHDSGKIYTYRLWYREFMNVKTDGTFSFSSGVYNHGIAKISFTGTTCTTKNFTYCEGGNDEQVKYYVNNELSTKAEFDEAMVQQDEKQGAQWLEFISDTAGTVTEITVLSDYRLLGDEFYDSYYEYTKALISGDTEKMEALSGYPAGTFDCYKGTTFTFRSITREANTGRFILTVDVSAGHEVIPSGTQKFYYCEYPRQALEPILEPTAPNATEASAELSRLLNMTMNYSLDEMEITEYIMDCLNHKTGKTAFTEGEITAYAKRCFDVESYTPNNAYNKDGSYHLVAHGGNSISHDIIGTNYDSESGISTVTVRFYADYAKTVYSHLVKYQMRKLEDDFAFVGHTITDERSLQPFKHAT